MTLQHLFQNTFTSRRSGVTSFAGIIRTATTFIKTTFKDAKELESKY